MQARNVYRSARLAAVGIAVLFVGAFVSAEEASAACGDYVTTESYAASSHSDSRSMPEPCSGLTCSKSRQPLSSTPAPELERSAPKAAFVVVGRGLVHCQWIACLIEDSPAKPIDRTADILRPPCL